MSEVGGGDVKSAKGKVKFFNDTKGYGFIRLEDGEDEGIEAFVHQTKIKMDGHRTLHENQPVQIDYYKEDKGYKASSVVPDLEWARENVKQNDHRRGGGGGGGGYRSDRYGGGGYHGGGGDYYGGGDGYDDGYGYSRGGYQQQYGGGGGYGGGGYGGGYGGRGGGRGRYGGGGYGGGYGGDGGY